MKTRTADTPAPRAPATPAPAGDDPRPLVHFTPRTGWINDPNGLIHADGQWHAFYQYNPAGITHGPMHWGHAVSDDLLNWSELDVALAPDPDEGEAFSGSAVAASEGPFAPALGDAAYALVYTGHQPLDAPPPGDARERQCLALAGPGLDGIRRFERNPVLEDAEYRHFRDPKVIFHAESGRWIMVITLGQEIGFYSSPDLVEWRAESRFGAGHGAHSEHPWECPDLFPLDAPDGARRWVLVVGVATGGVTGGSATQYFVGDFDGTTFTCADSPETVLWLDHGPDFYAAQTFSGAPQRTMLAWMNNWAYAQQTLDGADWRGSLSLARVLRLEDSPDGPRLCHAFTDLGPVARVGLGERRQTDGLWRIDETLELADGAARHLRLAPDAPTLELRRAGDMVSARLLRDGRLDGADVPAFAVDSTARIPCPGPVRLEAVMDRTRIEILIADGRASFSALSYAHEPGAAAPVLDDL
nr:glycoside hydrolase family 32 protein [Oceanicola granulosus]